jgi:hypothetical protein
MKLILILMALLISLSARADYLTKDSGQVITIPRDYNACAYDEQYNPRGFDEDGNFPLMPLVEAITGKLAACELSTSFPTKQECDTRKLVTGEFPDPRCKVYE